MTNSFEVLVLLLFLSKFSCTDDHNGYYQAIAIAKQCHYFLGETDTFIILTVAFHGCFVKKHVS